MNEYKETEEKAFSPKDSEQESEDIKTAWSLHDIIDDRSCSSISRLIILKAMLAPRDWAWHKEWIFKTFNLTNYQWRKVLRELKQRGYFTSILKENPTS